MNKLVVGFEGEQLLAALLVAVSTVVGIAVTFLVSRHYYRRVQRDRDMEFRERIRQIVVRPAARLVREIVEKAHALKKIEGEIDELKDLIDRAHDQGIMLEWTLQDLKTPVKLYNESLGYAEMSVDKLIGAYDGDSLRYALAEEIDRLGGELHTVRDCLYDYRVYEKDSHALNQWLKSICIVLKRCGKFPSLGSPPPSGGGNLTYLDDEWIVVSMDVDNEAREVFGRIKHAMRTHAVYTFRDNLVEACDDILKQLMGLL